MDNSSPKIYTEFLPISRADMEARGWDQLDFVVVGGDAYVDHPSFGTAIISRLLEAEGYKVGVLAQPRYTDCEDFKRFGKPKYGFFIGGGNVDSMVSHYSVAKIPRAEDEYSPGGKGGARPDRSATVYTKLAKEAYPDLPVILGGLEASLRRFAHYDYWMDTVLPSIAESSGADIISFGTDDPGRVFAVFPDPARTVPNLDQLPLHDAVDCRVAAAQPAACHQISPDPGSVSVTAYVIKIIGSNTIVKSKAADRIAAIIQHYHIAACRIGRITITAHRLRRTKLHIFGIDAFAGSVINCTVYLPAIAALVSDLFDNCRQKRRLLILALHILQRICICLAASLEI